LETREIQYPYMEYLINGHQTGFMRRQTFSELLLLSPLLVTLLIAGLVSGTLTGCSKTESAPGAMDFPPAQVKISEAKSALITDSSVYTGAVVSRQSVVLMPQVDGHVTRIFADAGQQMKIGQPILEINPENQIASVRGVEAAKESAQEDLATAKHTLSSYEAIRTARISSHRLAEANFDRYDKLHQSGVVSKEDMEIRQSALEVAKSELVSVEAQIQAQQATVRRMEKMLAQSGANVAQQKAQLKYYTIKAPFNGVLGDIPSKVGEYVNTSTRLSTIHQNRPLEIYVSIPIEKAKQVKMNMPIELYDSSDKKIGTSKVFFIAPNVATDSQTLLVKSQFGNDHDELRADEQVRARVIWNKKQGVLIPTEAVSHQSGQDFVFLEGSKSGKPVAQQLPVQLGAIEGSQYQVLQGLKAGQKIVVSGIQNLSDGAPISPTI
jgi:multidrug efflux pump subunit AcrA (membrane-fusion protein)